MYFLVLIVTAGIGPYACPHFEGASFLLSVHWDWSPPQKMSIFFLLIDTVPYLRCPPILGLHPAAGIWLIGLHSAPLFDIDLIIIAFFPEPPLPSAVLSYPADKSWVVLGLLQNWQELKPLNTNNTQIHTHKYTNTGTNTHIQIQKVGIWYLPSAQSVV